MSKLSNQIRFLTKLDLDPSRLYGISHRILIGNHITRWLWRVQYCTVYTIRSYLGYHFCGAGGAVIKLPPRAGAVITNYGSSSGSLTILSKTLRNVKEKDHGCISHSKKVL
jgi:hypothetical protein